MAERPRSLRDPHQAAWKDERGKKNTGGRRWSQGASQRPWRLPQRRLLGRVIDIIRMVPCGQGACGVTFPGSRCKSFVWPVLCGERVPSLPLLASQAIHQRRHPPVVLGNGRLRLPETVFTGLFRWAVAIRWRAGYRGAPHENIYTSKALDYPLLACYPV